MGGLGLKQRKLRWRQANRGPKGVAYIGMWACAIELFRVFMKSEIWGREEQMQGENERSKSYVKEEC